MTKYITGENGLKDVLNNLTLNCNVGEEITLNATIYDDNGNTIIEALGTTC